MQQRIISITIIIAVVGALFALFCYNSLNQSIDTKAWNENMTIGDKDTAKHHYVMYTDIFCPYCDKFSDALMTHDEEFKRDYIEGQNIYFEVRLTDMNYEMGHSKNSRPAAEGSYCAAKQDKFWEYYHGLLTALYDDYHSKGIGTDKTSKEFIPELSMDYFYKIGKQIEGLDYDSFKTCVDNHDTISEIDQNTARAQNITGGGVPMFQFDSFVTSGFGGKFDSEYDWEQAKLLLDAGL